MGDLRLTQSHDLSRGGYDLQIVVGVDLVRQRIKQRLLTILGEWFLDQSIGLPWFGELNQKGITQSRVRTLLIRQITQTAGVLRLEDFSLEYDNQNRTLSVAFRVETVAGILQDGITV